MDKFELKIKINPTIAEIVSDICFENFDCSGIVMAEETYKNLEMVATTEGILKAFISFPTEGLKITSDEKIKKITKEKLINARDLLLKRGFSNYELGDWTFELARVELQDWSKKWKENWTVTHVSEKIAVVPTWIDYTPQPNEVKIALDPGCAFGTGTHQTTQLCMKAIEKHMKTYSTMADIGMGSGILAICAKKFGADEVYGCDNDETVIEVARKNAILNNVECTFELNTVDTISKKYDFICANILHNVLFEIMGDLKNIMKDGSIMVLSGILDEKKSIVLEAIKNHHLNLIEETYQDQWVALIVEKIS